jgi:hypothetical protein
MMLALLRKDWRLNRAIVIACLVTSVVPYVFTVCNVWVDNTRYQAIGAGAYVDALRLAAEASLVITVTLAAAFGGLPFAGERRERTAEFLGMLPVSRGAILASKLIVPLVCLAVLIGTQLLVLAGANRLSVWMSNREEDVYVPAVLSVGYAAGLFGLGWALSVFLRSAAIAASVAVGVGVAMFFGMLEWGERGARIIRHQWLPDADRGATALSVMAATAVLIGGVAMVVTSLYYRRRVEP